MYKCIVKQLAIVTVVLGIATQAFASLTVGDANYLGRAYDAEPSGAANDVIDLANLITLPAGAPMQDVNGQDYDRLLSTLAGPFVAPTATGNVQGAAGLNTITLTSSFKYIVGKYDGPNWGLETWYFPDGISGLVELPASYPTAEQYGLSHIAAYNPSPIPEPASMLVWGSLALASTGVAWRRMVK